MLYTFSEWSVQGCTNERTNIRLTQLLPVGTRNGVKNGRLTERERDRQRETETETESGTETEREERDRERETE